MTLYVDVSESTTSVGKSVVDFFLSHSIRVSILPIEADYFFETEDGLRVCVERTNPGDFWNKITSGRLWEQLEAELESCGELYYVIAGYSEVGKLVRFRGRDILPPIEGAITSVSRRANLVILWDEWRFPAWLKSLYEKYMAKKEGTPPQRVKKKRAKHPCELAVEMLEALPGVGRKTAEEMLRDYASLRALLKDLAENPERVLARYVSRRDLDLAVSTIKYEGCREWSGKKEQK